MKKVHIFLLLLPALSLLPAAAQTNGSNSPYSRYGFGLLGDGANTFNKAMNGTGYGFRDGKQINTKNPASYSACDSLTFLFDVGVTFQNANLSAGGEKVNAHNTAIDCISAAWRAAPGLGMSVGMRPVSTIGYSMTSTETFQEGTQQEYTATYKFSGDGGLHEAFLGLGWTPFKRLARRGTGLSVGANVGYIWGSLDHTVYTTFDQSGASSSRQKYEADVRTYNANFGLQYEQRLSQKHSIVLGLSYTLGHDVNTKAMYANQKIVSSSVSEADTITCPDAFALPHTFGAGLVWNYNRRLRVGVDYTFEQWSKVKYPTLSADRAHYDAARGQFDDRQTVQFGAEYVPNPEGLRWRQHVRYRIGASFSSAYAKVDGREGPKSYTLSLGTALPIMNYHNNRSLLNISLQYEHVKPKFAGQITENYLRVCLSLSFNERWFWKWKVE